jgi:uncharacterized protein (TIGR02453 family)
MKTISPAVVSFLSDISNNNNREWYHANKAAHVQCKTDFDAFTNAVIDGMRNHIDLGTTTAKDCTFRIQRDVRFSKDKTPYNSHLSAYIGPNGKKTREAGFYFRIKPDGESVIGGGLWQGDAATLKSIRQEIDYSADEFHSIIDKKSFKKKFPKLEGDALKRPPKGYDAEHPELEYLKMKQWLATEIVPKKTFMGKDFATYVVDSYAEIQPFLSFLNRAFE